MIEKMSMLVPKRRWFFYAGFYSICVIVFSLAFLSRIEQPFQEAFARSVWPTVEISGLLILPVSYFLEWKKFWVFYFFHSVMVLLLTYVGYSLYIDLEQSTFSLNQAVLIDFKRYGMITLPISMALSMLSNAQKT